MKKLVLLALFTFGCIANDDVQFDSSTLDNTKLIYWVDNQTKSAVLYGKFEMFHKLKYLVSNTLLTTNEIAQTTENSCSYDKLVFVDSNKDIIAIFPIKNDSIFHNNINYTVSGQKLSNFFHFNQKRISNGDGLIDKHVRLNINNYSEKCL